MIYTGEFTTIGRIDVNRTYTIKIVTEQGTEEKTITLGDTPFIVEYEGDDENIYKPVRYSSATIKIISPDYNFDIYSGKAQGTGVYFSYVSSLGKTVVWNGYATPNLYDMGYNEDREEIEIECVDGLSTLKDIKYESTEKEVLPLSAIIRKIIKKCGCYKYFYCSRNMYLEDSTELTLDDLYMSENNFFDQKEDGETDEDVAWSCAEVLEEICRFLGVTAYAQGNEVWMVDINQKNNVGAYRYSLTFNSKYPESFSGGIFNLSQEYYAETNNRLSLGNVYNKITIKDDFYKYDSVFPSIYDNIKNITLSTDAGIVGNKPDKHSYGEVIQHQVDNGSDQENYNMIVFLHRPYNPQNDGYVDNSNAVFIKYFTNPDYKFYQYMGSAQNEVSALNYTSTQNLYGAFIGKYYVKELSKNVSTFEEIINAVLGNSNLDYALAKNDVSSVSLSNYIVLLNPDGAYHIQNSDVANYPYFSTSNIRNSSLFGGDNAYLVISGSYNYHYFSNNPYPIPSNQVDIAEGRYEINSNDAHLVAKLKWGNLYWNGNEWVTSSCTFNIPYLKESDERRADATMFKDTEFVNTVTWRIGTSEKGYAIPVPNLLIGQPEFTMYKPYDPTYRSTSSSDDKGQWYKHCCVFLKNFDIKAIIGDPTYSDVNDSDTVYTNVIDNANVKKLGDITFKVCTYDGKNPTYSAVAYKDSDGNYHWLDKTINKYLSNGETELLGSNALRQEEHLLYRLYKQYSTPSIILNLNLHLFGDSNAFNGFSYYVMNSAIKSSLTNNYFMVDSCRIDYKNRIVEAKLIELK